MYIKYELFESAIQLLGGGFFPRFQDTCNELIFKY